MKLKALIAFLICQSLAFNSSAFDLSEAYKLALNNDIQFQIESSNLIASQALLPQAQAAFKPQLSAQARGNYADANNSNRPSSSTKSFNSSLQYSQVIYNQQSDAAEDAAKAAVVQAQLSLKTAQQDLIIRTADAYFAILAAEDNLEFAQTEKKAIARQLEQAEKRFEVGLIAITDVKEAEAKFDTSVAQELAAKNQLNISHQSLELITGPFDATSIKQLDSSLVLMPPTPEDNQHWIAQAMRSNSAVLSAQAALAISAANRKKIAGADSATVTASGSYGVTSSNNSISGDNTANDLSLAITLNVPLYTGGLNSSLLAEQEAKYQSAKNTVLLQKRVAAQKARTLYLTILSGISQIKALQQASNSSQTALDATNAGFEVGTRTSVDVLTSIKETFRSQRDESSARYDYMLNMLKLKQAIGQLTAEDVIFTNAFFVN